MPSRSSYKKKSFFLPTPFVFLRTARTLRADLVRAKVCPAEEKLVGSRKCLRNRCKVCKNVVEKDTFESFVDKIVHKINHRFTSSDKCLVYLHHVKFVDGNILFKLLMSSDIDGTTIRIITGKVWGGMNIRRLSFLLIPKFRPQRFPRSYWNNIYWQNRPVWSY